MKNSNNAGFDQHSLLIVANTLSDQLVDTAQAMPTVEAIPAQVGRPDAAAMDNSYFSPDNIKEFERRGIDPYIATGREAHHRS